jgi:hypothetical protein
MAGKETTYVHTQFRVEMGNMNRAAREVLGPALEHRHGGLVHMEAGRMQLSESLEWRKLIGDLVTEGGAILAKYDRRMTDLGQAQQAAGGLPEVYGRREAYER